MQLPAVQFSEEPLQPDFPERCVLSNGAAKLLLALFHECSVLKPISSLGAQVCQKANIIYGVLQICTHLRTTICVSLQGPGKHSICRCYAKLYPSVCVLSMARATVQVF